MIWAVLVAIGRLLMTANAHGLGPHAPPARPRSSPRSTRPRSARPSRTRPSVIARGLGRCYGDAAQLRGGTVIDDRAAGRRRSDRPRTARSASGAGVSIDALLARSIPEGWFVPVTPGTRQVSIGGAIAADVHGKNHHATASFGAHVTELRLVTPAGRGDRLAHERPRPLLGDRGRHGTHRRRDARDGAPAARSRPIRSSSTPSASATSTASWPRCRAATPPTSYSVAWVDCMTRGRHMGRAVLTRGRPRAPRRRRAHRRSRRRAGARLAVPFDAPSGLLNPLTIRAFNEAVVPLGAPARGGRAPGARRPSSTPSTACATGTASTAGAASSSTSSASPTRPARPSCAPSSSSRAPRCRASSPCSSASDRARRARSPSRCRAGRSRWTSRWGPRRCPESSTSSTSWSWARSGRVYFAKDARLSPAKVVAMYPRLGDFLAVKARVDPEHHMASDLARRLALVGR